jgi:hypothetical protein
MNEKWFYNCLKYNSYTEDEKIELYMDKIARCKNGLDEVFPHIKYFETFKEFLNEWKKVKYSWTFK